MIDTKGKQKRPANKFFFDENNFNDDYVEEIVEEEPPPPVFSEDELAAAKTVSYQQGKQDGLAEAETLREKHVADLLGSIERNFQTLFQAEQQRAELYENEAVKLAHTIFQKLFPELNQAKGLDEIESVIKNVLNACRDSQDIIIEVQSDYVDSVKKRLETMSATLPEAHKIDIKGDKTLGAGDCRLRWKEGGGTRNASYLAEEIHKQLEHMLAERPTLHDNGEEIESNDAPQPPAENSASNEEKGATENINE